MSKKALYLLHIFVQNETGREMTNFYWVRFLLCFMVEHCLRSLLPPPPPLQIVYDSVMIFHCTRRHEKKKLFSLPVSVVINKMFRNRGGKKTKMSSTRLCLFFKRAVWGRMRMNCINFKQARLRLKNKQRNFSVVVVPACGVRWQSFSLLSFFHHSRKNGTLPDTKLMEHFFSPPAESLPGSSEKQFERSFNSTFCL